MKWLVLLCSLAQCVALLNLTSALETVNVSIVPADRDVEVASFYKLAHSVSLMHERVKYLVTRLRADYVRLCSRVPYCHEALLRMWQRQADKAQTLADAAQQRVDELHWLHVILVRLERPKHHGKLNRRRNEI